MNQLTVNGFKEIAIGDVYIHGSIRHLRYRVLYIRGHYVYFHKWYTDQPSRKWKFDQIKSIMEQRIMNGSVKLEVLASITVDEGLFQL